MRRMKFKSSWVLYSALAAALIGAFIFQRIPRPDGQAVLMRVIDGDTLKVKYLGRAERVRLIGIDTPESRANEKAGQDSRRMHQKIRALTLLGRQSTDFVKTLLRPGMILRLEFDAQSNDSYGRMLGYVYLPDGRMLNEVVLRAGYASLMTVLPNVKYQQRFLDAYRQAREEKTGLWREP